MTTEEREKARLTFTAVALHVGLLREWTLHGIDLTKLSHVYVAATEVGRDMISEYESDPWEDLSDRQPTSTD